MAAVLEKQDAAAKNGSQVDEQIAQATSRIRAHDLTFGGLVLVALLLVYTTAIICLDRYLNLPDWVRQVSLAAFLGVVVATAYLTLLSPLRKRINPLYAARQVERTIDDAKNSVTGYVDAQQKADLNPTVKAALASRAAKAAAEADVNRAVDHRSLIYLGAVSVVMLLALVVLFFVFRPAQFTSLMGRAFVPFTPTPLATQTQIDLVKPEPLDPTITTGQSISVAVHINGKVPKADSPEKVRLLVRHNPADPNYDEVPMVQGGTNRDWELRVPDYLVQNGFWYKVAAGDAVTEEHKVTVRSLPMFGEFQATYEYPKYLRWKSETANGPLLRGYRGTTVTLLATTNRDVRDGLMVVEPSNTRVNGTPVPGKPDTLQFVFKLTETGKYKLTFNATNGERSADPFQSFITVDTDAAPTVIITKPEEEEFPPTPLNGQIAIDGKIGDDFGIDTVTLKMKVVEPARLHRELPPVPYLNGKVPSFRREKDNTWPTDLDYKGSVDLAKIKKDAAGLPFELTPEMVLEVWLEATDNCTEPKPNVGRSLSKRVRLTPPKVEENEKAKLDEQKDARKNEEKQHDNQQQKKLDHEKRPPQPKNGQPQNEKKEPNAGEKQGDKKHEKTETKPGDKTEKQDETKGGMGDNPSKKPDDPMKPDMGMGTPPAKPEGPKDNPPKKNDPNDKGMGDGMQPMPPNDPNMGMGTKPEAPPPKSKEDQKLDKTAEELNKELKNQDMNGGAAKPNDTPNEAERTDPGKAKPEPKEGGGQGMNNASESKPEPKEPNANDPMGMGKPENAPAAGKPQGDVKKPDDPAAPKPEPKKGDPMNKGQNNTPSSENKSEPLGAPAGVEKDPPKGKQPEPKNPDQKQDPDSGSGAKPDSTKKDGDPSGAPKPDKKDPAADAGSKAKPMPDVNRGGEKPDAPKPKDPQPTDPKTDKKPESDTNAGDAKPEKAPPAAGAKPMPKEDMTGKGMDTETKPEAGANGASEAKPDAKPDEGKKQPMGGNKPVDKGMDKPAPADQKGDKGDKTPSSAPMPKEKLDEKQLKELEDAAKDLTNPDPKKKQDARDKLDKAVGEEKRKELEKLANDLQSPDEKTRKEAQEKLEKMKDQMKNGNGGKEPEPKEPPKLSEEQKKELTDALKDLQSNDPNKKAEAQKKLDKMIGEGARKEAEQLMEDLKSDDKAKQDAAKKKLDDFKKEMEKQKKDGTPEGKDKGKEPTKEELDDLAKKAQDLNSPDQKTREQAEKELDEKLGKENREKLQEEMKNKKPMDPKDLSDLEKELKEWRQQRLGGSPAAKGPMEEDAKNRLKTAELMLEEFEKNRYNKALQAKQGWTQEEYDKFLEGYRKRVEDMRKEADKPAGPKPGGPMDPGALFKGPQSGKVEDALGGKSGPASRSGATAPAPGFEDARRKFEEALKKKP